MPGAPLRGRSIGRCCATQASLPHHVPSQSLLLPSELYAPIHSAAERAFSSDLRAIAEPEPARLQSTVLVLNGACLFIYLQSKCKWRFSSYMYMKIEEYMYVYTEEGPRRVAERTTPKGGQLQYTGALRLPPQAMRRRLAIDDCKPEYSAFYPPP